MKLWLILFLCFISATAFAQEKEVSGIVFDKENKARIAKVKVQNTTTGKSAYNTFKLCRYGYHKKLRPAGRIPAPGCHTAKGSYHPRHHA
jgi:hypothetical protein